MRRLPLVAAFVALFVPAAATADTFEVVADSQSAAAGTALPSAGAPNQPGEIAVDQNFTSRPLWVEQRSVDDLRPIWESAGAAYGIPWQVLAAINKIESNFGGNMGPSSAGAVGWMQFMPDTWLRWGVDANRDGVADPWNAEDGIYAAARYLAASGGATDISRAIFSYNHADWYVNEVLGLANVYTGGTLTTSAFGMQPTIDIAAVQSRVDETQTALDQAVAREEQLADLERAAQEKYDATDKNDLLSDMLVAQKRLTLIGIRHDRARSLVARLRGELVDTQNVLHTAQASLFTPQLIGSWPFDPGLAGAVGVNPFGGDTARGLAVPALAFALAQLGTPYVWGGTGLGGFDCSGLVQAAYATAGVTLPRVAQQQFDAGPFVPAGEPLQPGDLVFFGGDAQHIEHVGMVSGPGLMVDAPFTGAVVRFDSYERSSFVGATRPGNTWATASSADTVDFSSADASSSDEVDFTAAAPESPTPGEILFTKNP
jgi:hypothetical protein